MKLVVERNDIVEGLLKSASIIPAKAGAAYLRAIWIKAEKKSVCFMSTDSNLEFIGKYPAEISEKGLVGVQGRNLVDLVRKLPAGKINFNLDANSGSLIISSGNRRYKLPVYDSTHFLPLAEFPSGSSALKVVWSGEYLRELVERVNYCVSDEDVMEGMACLFMGQRSEGESEGGAGAADKTEELPDNSPENLIDVCGLSGHQFARISFKNNDINKLLQEKNLLIQKKYIVELRKWLPDEAIEISLDKKRFFARTEDKSESLSLPLSHFNYPDYGAFISRVYSGTPSILEVNRLEIIDSLERAAIFNTDSSRCAFLSFTSEQSLEIYNQGQEMGAAKEIIDCAFKGDLEKIAFPTKDLIEILNHFFSEKVTFTFSGIEGPCGITGEESDSDYLVIIMPMKIESELYYNEEEQE